MLSNKESRKIEFLPVFTPLERPAFLTGFTLCFCLGICLVKFWRIPFVFLYTGCWVLVVLGLVLLRQEKCVWLLLVLGIFLGSLWLKNSYILSQSHIHRFTPLQKSSLTGFTFYKPKTVWLKGVIVDFPLVNSRYTGFVLEAGELTLEDKIYRISGKVLVKMFQQANVAYGQRVLLKGRLCRPYGKINDRLSWRNYLKRQQIYFTFIINSEQPIRYLGFAKTNFLKTLTYRMRKICRNIYFKHLPKTQAGIFSAIILGDRSQVGPYLERLFIQTGTCHILPRLYTKMPSVAL